MHKNNFCYLYFFLMLLAGHQLLLAHAHTTEDSLQTSVPSGNYPLVRAKKFLLRTQLPESQPQVRPFITDDSRVVGHRLAQLESWVRVDKESAQHWILGAYGPTRWLELTAGGVWGWDLAADQTGLAYALPLLQAKVLFREYRPNDWPGLGMVVGTFLPYGQGTFKPQGYGTFGFMTVSQCFGEGENVLLHGNVGLNYLHMAGENELLNTWGFGTQVKTVSGFHLVGELFSGDPYVPGSGTAYQVGFRHFFSDLLQIDMTLGKGIGGAEPLPLWGSAGVRIVFTRFRR